MIGFDRRAKGIVLVRNPRLAVSHRFRERFVVKADRSGQRRLARTVAHDLYPAWSPDGRKIASSWERACCGSHYSEVYVANADGSGQRRLTRDARHPFWSPEGRKIAFQRLRDGTAEVYVMNADGSGQRRLLAA